VLEEEIRRRGRDLVALKARAQELTEHNASAEVESLDNRLRALTTQLSTAPPSPPAVAAARIRETTQSPVLSTTSSAVAYSSPSESVISRTSYNVVSTSVTRTTTLAHSPAHYLQALRRLLAQISQLRSDMEQEEGVLVEDEARQAQDAKIKIEEQKVWDIQENLTELESQKDDVMLQASQEEAANIRSQMEQLLREWSKLSDTHTTRM
ncbi:unnamed protein product, partial [Candidula unifasciata]